MNRRSFLKAAPLLPSAAKAFVAAAAAAVSSKTTISATTAFFMGVDPAKLGGELFVMNLYRNGQIERWEVLAKLGVPNVGEMKRLIGVEVEFDYDRFSKEFVRNYYQR